MTILPDPIIVKSHSELAADRATVRTLSDSFATVIWPAAITDLTPGWSGIARRAFDARRDRLVAEVRRAGDALERLRVDIDYAINDARQAP